MTSPLVPRAPLVSRRRLFGVFGAGGAALVLAACGGGPGVFGRGSGASGGGSTGTVPGDVTPGAPLPVTEGLRSTNGLLEVVLTAAATMVPWGSGTRYALTYNGSVPGPTLRVRAGDTLRVTLRNELGHTTNLHTHGLHVSPEGTGDNVFVMVEPGKSFTYEYRIPADHPSGTFWYHPHHHGEVAAQLFGGLAGAIVVEDAIDDLAELRATTERVLVLSDPRIGTTAAVLDASATEKQQGREGDVVLVNGALRPRLAATAGTVERWRIVNASPSRYYRLSVDGPELFLIGTDQGRLAAPLAVREVTLTPGQRAEVLVPLASAGAVTLSTTEVERGRTMGMGGGSGSGGMGGMGGMAGMGGGASGASIGPVTEVLVVDVAPAAAGAAVRLPAALPGPAKGPGRADAQRTVRFGAMSMGNGEFVIDGRTFSAERVDSRVRLGTTEDWTIVNNSMMDHPFHLHVWPFEVIARSDGASPDPGWRDTVNVPKGQSVTIRIPFRDVGGRTVYHCHILDHEDLGMMATIEVA